MTTSANAGHLPSRRLVLSRLLSRDMVSRRKAARAFLLALAASMSAIGLAATSAWLLDRAAQHPAVLTLTAAIGAVQLFALGRAGAGYAQRLETHDLAFGVLGRLRVMCLSALAPLAPAALASHTSGDLLERATDDVDTLQNLYLRAIPPFVVAGGTSLLSVALAGFLVPQSGAVLAGGLLCAGVIIPLLAQRLGRDPGHAMVQGRASLQAATVESIQGAPELVAYGQADRAIERLVELHLALAGQARSAAHRRGLIEGLSSTIVGATALGMLAMAVPAVRAGLLPGVDLAVLPVLGLAAMDAVSGLPGAFSHLHEDIEAGARLLGLESIPPPVTDPEQPAPAPAGVPRLMAQGVTLRYAQDGPNAIENLDIDLLPGEILAIVGPSGSGKTTVANALLRFWPITSGSISLDGTDLESMTGDDARSIVGALDQRTHLFSTSIGDNLRIAKPDASEDEMWAALSLAHADKWVASLPDSLRTQVGEGGASVSGGERQRLALARLLLAGRTVVILDEPTAGLDPSEAMEMLRDVLEALSGRSVLLITHRREEAALADRVIGLSHGRLTAVQVQDTTSPSFPGVPTRAPAAFDQVEDDLECGSRTRQSST